MRPQTAQGLDGKTTLKVTPLREGSWHLAISAGRKTTESIIISAADFARITQGEGK